MNHYNVIERTKYYMKVEECENIEDLSNTFMTKEQINDIRGENPEYWIHDNHPIYFKQEIKKVLKDWVGLIKPGRGSTSVTTPAVLEILGFMEPYEINRMLREDLRVDYHVSGQRIINNKQSRNHPSKRKQELLKRDWSNLIRCCKNAIHKKYKVEVIFRTGHYGLCYEAYNNIMLTKKLCNWRDINHAIKDSYYIEKRDTPWIKQLWNDPKLYFYVPPKQEQTS